MPGKSACPGGSVVKNLPASARDPDLISGLQRPPEEGNGNPPQYSCLENPMEGGADFKPRVLKMIKELEEDVDKVKKAMNEQDRKIKKDIKKHKKEPK